MSKIVFATNNQNKLSEIKGLISNEIKILNLLDIECNEDLPETHDTLQENALEKARYIFDNYGYNCFADDTGLEIDILDGRPGVYSARYAGAHCSAEDNIKKILLELSNSEYRDATFRTVIALIINGEEYLFEGDCEGEITLEENGNKGFGYDPVFKPIGYNITFAQMTQLQKGRISHRGKAIKKLVHFLRK